jgi:hypothetical protein
MLAPTDSLRHEIRNLHGVFSSPSVAKGIMRRTTTNVLQADSFQKFANRFSNVAVVTSRSPCVRGPNKNRGRSCFVPIYYGARYLIAGPGQHLLVSSYDFAKPALEQELPTEHDQSDWQVCSFNVEVPSSSSVYCS